MKKTLALILCAALTSCASIINSSAEDIPIGTNVNDVKITITDSDNELVYTGNGPATVELSKRGGYFCGEEYTITAEKEGYTPLTKTFDTTISGWYFGNLILPGGLLGLLVVDPLTGCMWNFKNEEILLNMQPLQPAQPAQPTKK